ncbi:MAG: hypothetical protein E7404_04560 [Ruminococcaceae bacterium]|nr:hypothetical protein [Oscillospiraceae bacterium]
MNAEYYKNYEPFFGNWRIKRLIGEGSYGKVFEIEREDFGTTYKAALKTMTIPQNESEIKSVMADGMDEGSVRDYYKNFVEDVIKEFVLMSKLKGNSNIVSYEDHMVIEHEDKIGWDILIRMELLTPLIDYIKTINLKRKDVIQLGIDMCKALELCQKYNIIHRDIKPENIFVSVNKDFKLGDFGIARTLEQSSGMLSKKGTQAYMAPEIYKEESYRANVDIYSLGIVMYRLLNENRTPFLPAYPAPITYTDRETAIKRRISGETLPPPNHANGRLAEIILKACQHNPDERYQTPSEMREDLEEILHNKEEDCEIYASNITTHDKNSDFIDPSRHNITAKQEVISDFGGNEETVVLNQDDEGTVVLNETSNDIYNEDIAEETEVLFEDSPVIEQISEQKLPKADIKEATDIPSDKLNSVKEKDLTEKKAKPVVKLIIAAAIVILALFTGIFTVNRFIHKEDSYIDSVIIDHPSEVTIVVGEEYQILADMQDEERSGIGLTYKVEDEQIITVDENGLIKANLEGTTTVEIVYNSLIKPIMVTVENDIDITQLTNQFNDAETFLNNIALDTLINHDNIKLEFDALSKLLAEYDINNLKDADRDLVAEYLNAYNNNIKPSMENLETAYNKAVEIANNESANNTVNKTPPKKTIKKCNVCGSTSHSVHPVTCPTCGSTSHSVHPVTCPTCGSGDHAVHPVQPTTCPTCGSKYHTVHPEGDVQPIQQDF